MGSTITFGKTASLEKDKRACSTHSWIFMSNYSWTVSALKCKMWMKYKWRWNVIIDWACILLQKWQNSLDLTSFALTETNLCTLDWVLKEQQEHHLLLSKTCSRQHHPLQEYLPNGQGKIEAEAYVLRCGCVWISSLINTARAEQSAINGTCRSFSPALTNCRVGAAGFLTYQWQRKEFTLSFVALLERPSYCLHRGKYIHTVICQTSMLLCRAEDFFYLLNY